MFENYPDMMKIDDVRAATGMGRNAVYEAVKEGALKSFRIGRKIRVPKQCLIDFICEKCDTIYSNGEQIVLSQIGGKQ